MHIHDISTHLTVLHFQSLTLLFLVCPVQCSQLFQAELLAAGVHLILTVHRPLVGWLTVTRHEHGYCRLRILGVPMWPVITSISTNLMINIIHTITHRSANTHPRMHAHTHTHLFNGPLSRTTQVSWYQKGKTNLDFTEARDSEWQWHPLGHMQVCTSLQSDNYKSTPPLSFLQTRCPSCHPTNSVKELKAIHQSVKCQEETNRRSCSLLTAEQSFNAIYKQ